MATFGVIIRVKHSQIMLVAVSAFGLPLDFYNGFTEISIFYLLRSCFTPWWLLLWLLGFPHFGTLIWKWANQIATTSHLSNTELARILFPPHHPHPHPTPPPSVALQANASHSSVRWWWWWWWIYKIIQIKIIMWMMRRRIARCYSCHKWMH